MSDYHCHQFDGTTCGRRNCAASAGAMALAFAGGPQLTGRQFRDASGISCAIGVDTASGGLRATDVWRVARSFGVAIEYGGANGALADWPSWALEQRLREGEGCIVLGDCKVAPINPCATEDLYHSAFVHDFRMFGGVEQTHWHDPRNAGPTWEPITEVIRYWQGMAHGKRFAGFVAPNQVQPLPDTSTGDPVMEVPVSNVRRFIGTVTVKVDGASAIYDKTGQLVGVPKLITKEAYVVAKLGPITLPGGIVINEDAYLVGDRPAWLLRRDVNVTESTTPGCPPAIKLGPGRYEFG